MAFSLRSLSVLNYANGFTSWHYAAQDLNEALDAGFFNPAAELLAPCDQITITTSSGRATIRFVAKPDQDIILVRSE